MPRYIDAEEVKKKKYYDLKRHEYCVAVAAIDQQLTADVEEVKYGKNVTDVNSKIERLENKNAELKAKISKLEEKQMPMKTTKRDLWELGTAEGDNCPNCNYEFPISHKQPKYCENCGQKLDWSNK